MLNARLLGNLGSRQICGLPLRSDLTASGLYIMLFGRLSRLQRPRIHLPYPWRSMATVGHSWLQEQFLTL